MLHGLRMISSIAVVVLAGFSLITENFTLMPYLMLVLGISFLLTGVTELQKERQRYWGYMSILVSLFIFFVSIKSFLLS